MPERYPLKFWTPRSVAGCMGTSKIEMHPADFAHTRLHFIRGTAKEGGLPFRAPHHSVNVSTLIAELAIAATGVLTLCDVHDFRASDVRTMIRTWGAMVPSARPRLVLLASRSASEEATAVVNAIVAMARAYEAERL